MQFARNTSRPMISIYRNIHNVCKSYTITIAVFKIHNHHDYFIIKMHYISCFLNLFWRGTIVSYYYYLCKNKANQQNDLCKQKECSIWFVMEETRNRPNDKLPTIWQSDPKNKYHAINSVYYSLSIQVYITFLSIHVDIIIHIVLLCLLCCILFNF